MDSVRRVKQATARMQDAPAKHKHASQNGNICSACGARAQ